MKVLVLGMDGNILDNYFLKSECAGFALQKNAKLFYGVEKSIDFFSKIYIETSGMNSIEQFRTAYKRIKDVDISENLLEQTERDYRKRLKELEGKVKIFVDVLKFFRENGGKYKFAVTTTVPVDNIEDLNKNIHLDEFIDIICARHGVWHKGKVEYIKLFDKGEKHYKYLMKRYKIDKSDLIAISSTRSDILNAKKSGIISIAVEHIHNRKKMTNFNPDYIVKNFTELPDLLQKIII